MSPLAHHQAPHTRTRPRTRAPRVSVPTSHRPPLAAAASANIPRTDHRVSTARVDGFSAKLGTSTRFANTTTALRRQHGGENGALSASSVGAKVRDEPFDRPERRKHATSSSSTAAPLVRSHERSQTPAVMPIASSPYVPPHIRKAAMASASSSHKENVPLGWFDRSACPEPEDSFYSHVSSTFSTPPLGSTPNTSFPQLSSSSSSSFSARLATSTRTSRIQTSASSASPALRHPIPLSPTSPGVVERSPILRTSRQRLVPSRRQSHPAQILEDDERDDDGLALPARPVSERSWADEVEAEYANKSHVSLSPAEEALLGQDGADAASEGGFDVQIAVQLRRESAFTTASSALGVPEDENEIREGACTGCGAEQTDCFINLTPCGHALCPVCINALVNAAAHKPPRPTTCFACASAVRSFVATVPASESGKGLVTALLDSLAAGQVERRQSVVAPVDVLAGEGVESVEMRRKRRRSSVVAAALATIFSSPMNKHRTSLDTATSSAGTLADEVSDFGSLESLESPLARRSRPNSAPLTASPTVRINAAMQGIDTTPFGRGEGGTATESIAHTQDLFSSTSSTSFSRRASSIVIPPVAWRANIDWPVVRLDNVPWEVTVDEVEAWLPRGTLASDGTGTNGDTIEEVHEDEGRVGDGEGVTLAVHILCNRADGRTLNQAYIECSSRAAARKIVRLRDGFKLRNRTIHVAMSSQGELLGTIFPTYLPGFDGLEPFSIDRRKSAAPIPLLVQTELTGLLNLCRLESMHPRKAPERPFFNIVTLLEKMPWAYPQCYNSAAVVRMFNTSCAAIEILATVKRTVVEWQDILAVLVDAILRCPVFRPQQKQKAVHLAASLGYERYESTSSMRVPLPHVAAPRTVAGVFDGFSFPFKPSSLQQPVVSTAPPSTTHGSTLDPLSPLAVPPGVEPVERRTGTSTHSASLASSSSSSVNPSSIGKVKYRRRRSSLVAELGIEPGLLDAVARALGVALVGSSSHEEAEASAIESSS
ncbi:hypothetical protein JCM8208_005346 [Rhodotorula glutinis]